MSASELTDTCGELQNDAQPLIPLQVFRLCERTKRWLPTSSSSSSYTCTDADYHPAPAAPLASIRLATFNVLADTFPRIVELAIRSEERLAAYTSREGYTPSSPPTPLTRGNGTSTCASARGSDNNGKRDGRCRPLIDLEADILGLNEVSLNIMARFCGLRKSFPLPPPTTTGIFDEESFAEPDGGIMAAAGFRYAVFFGAPISSETPHLPSNGEQKKELCLENATLLERLVILAAASSSTSTNGEKDLPISAMSADVWTTKQSHGCAIFSRYPINKAWSGAGAAVGHGGGREVFALIEGLPILSSCSQNQCTYRNSQIAVTSAPGEEIPTATKTDTHRGPKMTHGGSMVFCSRHTSAYADELNKRRREDQVGRSAEHCRRLVSLYASSSPPKSNGCGTVGDQKEKALEPSSLHVVNSELKRRRLRPAFALLGDLNFHDVNEDRVALANNLVDVYAATVSPPDALSNRDPNYHPDHSPCASPHHMFTFDPLCNPMIKRYIPGENRRMRLDRILMPCEDYYFYCCYNNTDDDTKLLEDDGRSRNAALNTASTTCTYYGTTSYSFASPQFMWATDPIDEELTLSDHYGLAVDICLHATQQHQHHRHNHNHPWNTFSVTSEAAARCFCDQCELKWIKPDLNPKNGYPGYEEMKVRASLPNDRSDERSGLVKGGLFWSRWAGTVAVSHVPWLIRRLWSTNSAKNKKSKEPK